jgi:hypothetical protein
MARGFEAALGGPQASLAKNRGFDAHIDGPSDQGSPMLGEIRERGNGNLPPEADALALRT